MKKQRRSNYKIYLRNNKKQEKKQLQKKKKVNQKMKKVMKKKKKKMLSKSQMQAMVVKQRNMSGIKHLKKSQHLFHWLQVQQQKMSM